MANCKLNATVKPSRIVSAMVNGPLLTKLIIYPFVKIVPAKYWCRVHVEAT